MEPGSFRQSAEAIVMDTEGLILDTCVILEICVLSGKCFLVDFKACGSRLANGYNLWKPPPRFSVTDIYNTLDNSLQSLLLTHWLHKVNIVADGQGADRVHFFLLFFASIEYNNRINDH